LLICAANELFRKLIVFEHIYNQVCLAFDPEFVPPVDVVGDSVRVRFTGIGDDAVVFGMSDGAHSVVESTDGKIVPGSESVAFG
jgi:hypothetical protein